MPNSLAQLIKTASRLPTPKDLFAGISSADLPRPDNINIFTRTRQRQLHDGSHVRRQHHHHRHVLLINLKTNGTVCHDQHLLPGLPGQALLTHPHQFHHYRDIAAPTLCWLFITFELSPSHYLDDWRNTWRTLNKSSLETLSYLLAIWSHRRTPANARLITALLTLLLLQLSTTNNNPAPAPPPAANGSLLQKINTFIDGSPSEMHTIKTLAEALHLSESHLRRLFREETSLSLGRYLRERRISLAMTLLRRTPHPNITAIATACGFDSLYTFSRSFRHATTLSPRAYARQTVPTQN